MYTPQFDLFVGSEDSYLAAEALSYNTQAKLLLEEDIQDFLRQGTGCVYTSLADIGNLDNLLSLCLAAEKIFYRPSSQWAKTDNKQKYWTEHILWYVSQFKPIDGLKIDFDHVFWDNLIGSDCNNVQEQILWTAGCSITAGVGINLDQTWTKHVADHFGLTAKNLAESGSSILWQAHKICQSPIKANDLVFWGLTGHHRLLYVNNDHDMTHVTTKYVQNNPSVLKTISLDFLLSESLIYLNIMAIRSVYSFCRKLGAKLVVLGLFTDWDSIFRYYNVPVFRQYAVWPKDFVDRGTDNEHPGPIQHRLYANEFIDFYNETYQRNISPMAQDLVAK
jgi:hypothetical protein